MAAPTTTAQATAAPTTVELGGKQYRVSPLRDKDYGEFEKWVQDRHMELAQRAGDGLSVEDRQALLKHAYDRASQITMASPEAIQAVITLEGSIKLLWLHLRHEHPDLTEETVSGLLMNAATQEVDVDAMDAMSKAIERVTPKVRTAPAPKGKRGAKKKRIPTRRQ